LTFCFTILSLSPTHKKVRRQSIIAFRQRHTQHNPATDIMDSSDEEDAAFDLGGEDFDKVKVEGGPGLAVLDFGDDDPLAPVRKRRKKRGVVGRPQSVQVDDTIKPWIAEGLFDEAPRDVGDPPRVTYRDVMDVVLFSKGGVHGAYAYIADRRKKWLTEFEIPLQLMMSETFYDTKDIPFLKRDSALSSTLFYDIAATLYDAASMGQAAPFSGMARYLSGLSTRTKFVKDGSPMLVDYFAITDRAMAQWDDLEAGFFADKVPNVAALPEMPRPRTRIARWAIKLLWAIAKHGLGKAVAQKLKPPDAGPPDRMKLEFPVYDIEDFGEFDASDDEQEGVSRKLLKDYESLRAAYVDLVVENNALGDRYEHLLKELEVMSYRCSEMAREYVEEIGLLRGRLGVLTGENSNLRRALKLGPRKQTVVRKPGVKRPRKTTPHGSDEPDAPGLEPVRVPPIPQATEAETAEEEWIAALASDLDVKAPISEFYDLFTVGIAQWFTGDSANLLDDADLTTVQGIDDLLKSGNPNLPEVLRMKMVDQLGQIVVLQRHKLIVSFAKNFQTISTSNPDLAGMVFGFAEPNEENLRAIPEFINGWKRRLYVLCDAYFKGVYEFEDYDAAIAAVPDAWVQEQFFNLIVFGMILTSRTDDGDLLAPQDIVRALKEWIDWSLQPLLAGDRAPPADHAEKLLYYFRLGKPTHISGETGVQVKTRAIEKLAAFLTGDLLLDMRHILVPPVNILAVALVDLRGLVDAVIKKESLTGLYFLCTKTGWDNRWSDEHRNKTFIEWSEGLLAERVDAEIGVSLLDRLNPNLSTFSVDLKFSAGRWLREKKAVSVHKKSRQLYHWRDMGTPAKFDIDTVKVKLVDLTTLSFETRRHARKFHARFDSKKAMLSFLSVFSKTRDKKQLGQFKLQGTTGFAFRNGKWTRAARGRGEMLVGLHAVEIGEVNVLPILFKKKGGRFRHSMYVVDVATKIGDPWGQVGFYEFRPDEEVTRMLPLEVRGVGRLEDIAKKAGVHLEETGVPIMKSMSAPDLNPPLADYEWGGEEIGASLFEKIAGWMGLAGVNAPPPEGGPWVLHRRGAKVRFTKRNLELSYAGRRDRAPIATVKVIRMGSPPLEMGIEFTVDEDDGPVKRELHFKDLTGLRKFHRTLYERMGIEFTKKGSRAIHDPEMREKFASLERMNAFPVAYKKERCSAVPVGFGAKFCGDGWILAETKKGDDGNRLVVFLKDPLTILAARRGKFVYVPGSAVAQWREVRFTATTNERGRKTRKPTSVTFHMRAPMYSLFRRDMQLKVEAREVVLHRENDSVNIGSCVIIEEETKTAFVPLDEDRRELGIKADITAFMRGGTPARLLQVDVSVDHDEFLGVTVKFRNAMEMRYFFAIIPDRTDAPVASPLRNYGARFPLDPASEWKVFDVDFPKMRCSRDRDAVENLCGTGFMITGPPDAAGQFVVYVMQSPSMLVSAHAVKFGMLDAGVTTLRDQEGLGKTLEVAIDQQDLFLDAYAPEGYIGCKGGKKKREAEEWIEEDIGSSMVVLDFPSISHRMRSVDVPDEVEESAVLDFPSISHRMVDSPTVVNPVVAHSEDEEDFPAVSSRITETGIVRARSPVVEDEDEDDMFSVSAVQDDLGDLVRSSIRVNLPHSVSVDDDDSSTDDEPMGERVGTMIDEGNETDSSTDLGFDLMFEAASGNLQGGD